MKTIAPNPLPDQIKDIQKFLERDKNCNFSQLEYFLKQIVINRDITFHIPRQNGEVEELVVPAKKAWEIIALWSQGEGNLPVGDRNPKFNIRSGATRLLNYLQTNISGKTAEAAGSYRLILEQAKYPAPPVSGPAKNVQESNLQKVFDLRRKQIKLLENKFFNPLSKNLSKSKIFDNIKDAPTRALVIQMLAAGNTNFRYIPKDGCQNFTAEKIHQLLLHQPGIRDTNAVMRLAYSKTSQKDFGEMSSIIEETIEDSYGGDENKYQQDMATLRSLSGLSPSLDNIQYLVKSLNITSSPEETAQLVKSIRSHIISAASGDNHQDGSSILRAALKSVGFAEISVDHFESIAPFVEEIQIKQRHHLLGSDLSDQDSRLAATSGLAAELGVDLTIPWLSEKKLNEITERVVSPTAEEYYNANPGRLKDPKSLSLQEAFDFEYGKGDSADPKKLSEFLSLMGKRSDFQLYHQSVDGNFGYQFQEFVGKSLGNYLAIKQPIDRFTEKVWGGIDNIDDIVRGPQRKLVDWWEKQIEKYPWLNPGALIANKWVEYQSNIAIKIHAWALKLSTTTASAWIKSFAGHITDFTEGFVKHEASWSGASSFFVHRKIGNTLDWATKFASKGKYETFKSLRGKVAQVAWSGFAKLAPGLAAKMIASGLGKVLVGIIAGEMTMGVTVAIQIGWEVIKWGFGFIKKIISDSRFREKIINRIPLLVGAAVTSGLIVLAGLPTAIVAGISLAGVAILGFIQAAILSLAPLFALAAAIALGAVAIFSMIWFNLITPTFHLDSGVSNFVASIICDDAGNTTIPGTTGLNTSPAAQAGAGDTSSVLARASCLAKYLNGCYGPSVNASNITQGLSCLATYAIAPAAIEEIKRSATSFTNLQCVGFVKAAVVWAGKSIGSNNACGYVSDPKFVSGLGGIKQGDAVVFKSSGVCSDAAPGHIGFFKEDAGKNICLIDANQRCPGCVVDGNCLPKTNVAGYLRL